MRYVFIAAIAAMLATPVLAKAPPQPPEPPEHPTWEVARDRGQAALLTGYFDPSSVQISYAQGFHWGFVKPPFSKRVFAWVACGFVNAKNRMGGYVGSKPFYIAITQSGEVAAGTIGDTYVQTSCADGSYALQPELQGQFGSNGPIGTSSAPSGVSIADELAKLADLKAKGIITDAEFQAGKAKLLAQ